MFIQTKIREIFELILIKQPKKLKKTEQIGLK